MTATIITTANIKNRSGQFVEPTLASTSAAGDGLKVPADLAINTIDAPNAAAYPITSQTFIDVYSDVCKAGMKLGDRALACDSFRTATRQVAALAARKELLGHNEEQGKVAARNVAVCERGGGLGEFETPG